MTKFTRDTELQGQGDPEALYGTQVQGGIGASGAWGQLKLAQLDQVESVEELKIPPGNRLHALGGDREGQWAIRINDQYRICFRFEDGDAYDVEATDYH